MNRSAFLHSISGYGFLAPLRRPGMTVLSNLYNLDDLIRRHL